MTDALTVANYIIELSEDIGEPVTNMKLQKLLYYSYAWYAVENDGAKLFEEPIQAWKYGPVVVSVYEKYKEFGADTINSEVDGDESELNKETKELVEEVFTVYGGKTAIELMELTHSEAPWRETFSAEEQQNDIPHDLIYKFYTERKKAAEHL